MISLFSHAISALLSKLFDKWTNSYIDRENEENSYRKSVRVSRTLGIVGGIWLILFAAFGVLGIIIWADDMTDWYPVSVHQPFGYFLHAVQTQLPHLLHRYICGKAQYFREKAGLPLGRTSFGSTKRCCLHIDFSHRKTPHCFQQGVCWQ